MCVILFSFLEHPDRPLVLLANRDEFYERPTAPAQKWKDFPFILAGRDLVSGGTWLGVTDSGRFAAVTNFRDPSQEAGRLSRGDLVAGFLKTDVAAGDYLKRVESRADQYTGFNLIVGELNRNKREIFYFSNRGSGIEQLGRGLYGLSNHLLNTPWPKIEKGKKRLAELLRGPATDKEELFRLLGDRSLAEDTDLPDTGIGYEREKRLSAIFIKTPGYGTRCSTVLSFNKELDRDFEERVFV